MSFQQTHEAHEREHVHKVYSKIAKHFSSSRYKPWPVVENFIKSQELGSIGVDVGCGNGKYLGLRPVEIWMSGNDRCRELMEIVVERKHEGLVCDALSLPYRVAAFDFALSIAVVHHFSHPERRLSAVAETLKLLRRGGRALFFVWAVEQSNGSRRKDEFAASTGGTDGDAINQDIYVPWRLMPNFSEAADESEIFQRYYHLFRKGELDDLVIEASRRFDLDCQIQTSGYDRDNHYVVVERQGPR